MSDIIIKWNPETGQFDHSLPPAPLKNLIEWNEETGTFEHTGPKPIRCLHFEHGYEQAVNGPCCYQSIPGVSSFTEMQQHPVYLKIQSSFAQGEWPTNYCTACSDVEKLHTDQGYSKRQATEFHYRRYIRDNIDAYVPGELYFLTIDAGRYCNIQCRSCNPYNSSSWIPERIAMEPRVLYSLYPDNGKKVFDVTYYNNSIDDFSKLKHVNVLGGEPLYNSTTNEMLEKILEAAGPDVSISISTNGTVSYKNVPVLKKFNKVGLTFSIDATGPAFEFIRTGANWENVKQNIQDWVDLKGSSYAGVHPTYSVLNIFETVKLKQYFVEAQLNETNETTFLTYPDYLNYSILTERERIIVVDYLNQNNLSSAAKVVESYSYIPENRNRFFRFMNHTKEYHNLDWQTSLPELYNLMKP